VAREHGNIHASGKLNAEAVLRLLERCDALRKPQRFSQVLLACECDARGRGIAGDGLRDRAYPQAARLQSALDAALAQPTHDIAAQAMAQGLKGPEVGRRIHAARVRAIEQVLATMQTG